MPVKKTVPEQAESKILGVTVGEWVKILVSSFLTLVITWLSFQWVTNAQAANPQVSWKVQESVTFPGNNNSTGIVTINLTNDGRKVAENIHTDLDLSGGNIADFVIEPGTAKVSILSRAEQSLKLLVPFINDGEVIKLKVLTKSQSPHMNRNFLDVVVHAKGVKVINNSSIEFGGPWNTGPSFWWVLIIAVPMSIIAVIGYRAEMKSLTKKEDEEARVTKTLDTLTKSVNKIMKIVKPDTIEESPEDA